MKVLIACEHSGVVVRDAFIARGQNQAIPPAYSEFIGGQVVEHIGAL